ncbi:MAG: glycosyl hydrolase [Bacteroidetes bacterium]|nr:glycosyl hydrolase [Bacteroidota bacterium]
MRTSSLLFALFLAALIDHSGGPLHAQSMRTPSTQELDHALRAQKFRCIGPYRGGRSLAVAGHPDLPHTYYFGATGGGVWKSEDDGDSWRSVSDSTFTSSSIGAITIAPSDPNVVYVGTGETDIRGNISPGDGMYRTTDGGATWNSLGLKNARMIADIVVHPTDADVVLVSSMGHVFGPNPERGIFKSTDGGKSWKKVLFRNDSTGGMTLKMDPHNPRILYASLWQAYRNAHSMSSGGAGSGLFKSTDGGDTWKEITKNPGLPTGILGKICVDVSRAQRGLVFAMVENENGGLFKSNDAGATWTRMSTQADIRTRPWYFSHVYADPFDASIVYVLNVGMYKSVDGGASFSGMGTKHGDHHDMWIDPKNNQRMMVADDGGAVVSVDGGRHWTEQDLATSQFYHVSVDDHFPYRLYGAQQDNSTVSIPHRAIGDWSIDRSRWYSVAGFESGYVIPHHTDANVTLGGNYSGYLSRYDRSKDQNQDISVYPNNPIGEGSKDRGERFQWTFPILFSKHDKALYTTSQHVWRSTNEGMSWTKISPDLTTNDTTKQMASGGPITKDNTGVEVYCTIFTLAESPVKQGVFWAGSDDGLIHVSTDNAATWKNVTPSGLPAFSLVSMIEASPYDAGTAYAAVNRYKLDDQDVYIYKTTNYGASWTKITSGIPSGSFARVVREDPVRKDLLYCGTERGLYVSFDGGTSWSRFLRNLPLTPIHDLVVHGREHDLVLATHGRSFWIFDDLTTLRQLTPSVLATPFHVFTPRHAYRVDGGSWYAPTMDVGENAPNGVMLRYWLADTTSKELTITIRTQSGDSVIAFSNKKDRKGEEFKNDRKFYRDSLFRPSSEALTVFRGQNQFQWNMRWPDAEELEGVMWGAGTTGPRVAPGTYTATFTLGADTQRVSFEIKKDPRLDVADADLVAQERFLRDVTRTLSDVHKAIKRMRDVRAQVNAAVGRTSHLDSSKTKEIAALSKTINDTLQHIEDSMVQTKAKAGQDLLNYPVKLNNKIASLSEVASSADTRPTQQTLDLYAELASQAAAKIAAIKSIESDHVRRFNEQISALSLPAVLPEKKK